MTVSRKPFVILLEVNSICCGKTDLILKRNDLIMKIYNIIFILKRSYLVTKIFHIVRLNVLDIHLSIIAPIVLLFQVFDGCVISHGILNGVFLIELYLYIFNEEEKLCFGKIFCYISLKKNDFVKKTITFYLLFCNFHL